jgi:hypothetical protein
MPVAAPRAFLWRGIAALRLDGKRDRAARLFRESLAIARRLDMPYDEAMALAALGEHTAKTTDEAQRYIADAALIFRRIGAFYDLERVERLHSMPSVRRGHDTQLTP